jgi:hypothetical protein
MTMTNSNTEPVAMAPLSRFLGGDTTPWGDGETVEGIYLGYHSLIMEAKPVALFNVLEDSGTVVRFLGTAQTAEMVFLPSGTRVRIAYCGKGVSSKGRKIKLFRIECAADALAARAVAIREQLLNPGSQIALPAPLPGLPALDVDEGEDE